MYKFKKYEFELTPEERDMANFMIETKQARSAALALGGKMGPMAELETLAFADFRRKFYERLRRRVGLDETTEAMSLSPDGKGVILIEVTDE